MPARAERIYLFPDKEGQPCRVMEFPLWWDRRGFFEKYRNRQIDLGNPMYVDYALLLTAWEAAAWDKQCREQSARDPRRSGVESEMQRVASELRESRWVVVESYEWESGLD